MDHVQVSIKLYAYISPRVFMYKAVKRGNISILRLKVHFTTQASTYEHVQIPNSSKETL